MKSKNKNNKVSINKTLKYLNVLDSCDVSKASVELMLERFCKGKKIDFPFSQ